MLWPKSGTLSNWNGITFRLFYIIHLKFPFSDSSQMGSHSIEHLLQIGPHSSSIPLKIIHALRCPQASLINEVKRVKTLTCSLAGDIGMYPHLLPVLLLPQNLLCRALYKHSTCGTLKDQVRLTRIRPDLTDVN